MADLFLSVANARPSAARIDETKTRLNQQPAINDAKQVADEALTHPPVGTVTMWAGPADPPLGPQGGAWFVCDGRTFLRLAYPALFAAIGTAWNTGGETVDQFRIPDLRSRVPVGSGQGSGLTNRVLASKFGEENHLLTQSEMPSHTHSGSGSGSGSGSAASVGHSHGGSTVGGTGNHEHNYSEVTSVTRTPANLQDGCCRDALNSVGEGTSSTSGSGSHTHSLSVNNADHSHSVSVGVNTTLSINNTGGGGAHNNVQPSIALNFIIRAL